MSLMFLQLLHDANDALIRILLQRLLRPGQVLGDAEVTCISEAAQCFASVITPSASYALSKAVSLVTIMASVTEPVLPTSPWIQASKSGIRSVIWSKRRRAVLRLERGEGTLTPVPSGIEGWIDADGNSPVPVSFSCRPVA